MTLSRRSAGDGRSSSRPTSGRATAWTGRRPRSIPLSPRERFRVSERSYRLPLGKPARTSLVLLETAVRSGLVALLETGTDGDWE